jgi:hypothetical protein
MISLLLISEFFPALSDSDMGLPEINMASYTLGKAEEHSILATHQRYSFAARILDWQKYLLTSCEKVGGLH